MTISPSGFPEDPNYLGRTFMSEPSGGELARRIDQLERRLESGFTNLDTRLDSLVTEKTILAYLATRDAEMKGIKDDIIELKKANLHIKKSVEDVRDEALAAKRFAWQIGIPLGAFMLGVVGFVYNLAQTGVAG